ncbi:uncharacterized protein LOC108675409 [Hyalella azteca]|uniref:Uncharacterized protein LOC108675409 n=1 Tax=Hyalella azteca TaxID=294128 RepID=A0A8B7P1F4_HYAAZ|nr:uncharacterized protein LOC108675409 [Hyalella azteca]
MMKSVCHLLLLAATFAYASAEGSLACSKYLSFTLVTSVDQPAFIDCKSDPAGRAALTALASGTRCSDYKFYNGEIFCQIAAAPYMKCVAGKLGWLKADGSIDSAKVLAKLKSVVTYNPSCRAAQYDFAVKQCGTTINYYAFLEKVACLQYVSFKYAPG